MSELGEHLASGRTSDVYAFGADRVIKVLRNGVPPEWAATEATLTSAVRMRGVAAAEVFGVEQIRGRAAIVFERVDGPSMWQAMCTRGADLTRLTAQFAQVHRSIQRSGLPTNVPDMAQRLSAKIGEAGALPSDDRRRGQAMVEQLSRGAALLHGDFHPGNVLMSKDGPVVIDWFDAAIGHPIADVVRTSILLRPRVGAAPAHLPGASVELLDRLHRGYLAAFTAELTHVAPDLGSWEASIAAGRLAERAESDDLDLVNLWTAGQAHQPSQTLAAALPAEARWSGTDQRS